MNVCGVQILEPLQNWQFGAILAEKFTNFTAVVDTENMTDLHSEIPSILGKIN